MGNGFYLREEIKSGIILLSISMEDVISRLNGVSTSNSWDGIQLE